MKLLYQLRQYEFEGHKVKAFLLPGRGQNVGKPWCQGLRGQTRGREEWRGRERDLEQPEQVRSQEGAGYGTRTYTDSDLTGRQCRPPRRTDVHGEDSV